MGQYASELDQIQDTVLEVISACRDEIEELFAANSNDQEIVDHTLKRLFAYQSDRSQTISYLVSSNYIWDAEIIMRSFYEAHTKIWFICQSPGGERESLAKEFWGDYSKMHAHKKAARAKPGAEFFAQNSRLGDAAVYEALANAQLFEFHEGNKRERKSLEQKWSFSEIIERLERDSSDSFPLTGVSGLKHMYGLQSHLIHADESALDLMLDRNLRSTEELEILTCGHVCRIYSDQVSLWAFSTSALRHRYDLEPKKDSNRWRLWKHLHELTKPFHERFNQSQQDFYRNIDEGNQPGQ
ncbi:MAG: DUF5677 domain-containing protein [Rhodospirillales bacterium]|nr:DUF5677 domain-containing protein [Rhodospirillales bacterium]